ncbi:hypothetical protein RI129_004911 [Pyrocoelia pectoralis]|uniref:Uncharacterized protein n=1 Tax=Pyrocoelia pectoralis TaxID=417401 RepID=A0AAN7ZL04_9COLE
MEEIQTSRSDFQNFPFYTLQELNPLDYGEIRKAASLLNIFVQYKEFYTNFNNCMDQTLDFILNNARYLTLQNSQVEPIILLRLLKRIIMRVGNCSDNNFLLKNQERIVEFLIYTITNSKEEEALLEIGKTSSEMLLVYHMEGKMATGCTNVQSLLIKCCKLFRNTRNSYLLTRIIRIILDRRFINSFNNAKEKHHLLKWVEEFAVEMLTKVNLQSHIMEICNCIIIYYRIHEENDVKGYINLQECIIELIKYRTNNPLRSKIDDILAIIVRQHYLSDSYSWPGGELALWNTIQNLPVDFKNWRHNEKEFFFIFAYLQVNAPSSTD